MTDTQTWTLGPRYPVASCSRCGAGADAKDVASGFCWRCGYLGAVEFKEPAGEVVPAAEYERRYQAFLARHAEEHREV